MQDQNCQHRCHLETREISQHKTGKILSPDLLRYLLRCAKILPRDTAKTANFKRLLFNMPVFPLSHGKSCIACDRGSGLTHWCAFIRQGSSKKNASVLSFLQVLSINFLFSLEDSSLATLVAHDCGYPLSRYTCRTTRVAADFLDFIAFCRCSTGVALHP